MSASLPSSTDEFQPAGQPPPGVTSNFVDPPDQQAAIIGVYTTLIILTLAFLFVRLYSNFIISRYGGYDSYLCIAATVLSFGYMSCIFRMGYATRHIWDFPLQWYDGKFWKLRFTTHVLRQSAFFASRLPVFALLLRVFGYRRRFRYAVYVGLIANFFIYLTLIPFFAHYCTPASGYGWSSVELLNYCKILIPAAVAQGGANIVLDIYIFIIPLPVVWALNMPLKRRLGVLTIFATGFIAVIASGVNQYYRYKLSDGNDISWNDGRYAVARLTRTSSVEINSVIICSCIPACPAFFKHFFSSSSSSSSSSCRSPFSSPPFLSPAITTTTTTTTKITGPMTSNKLQSRSITVAVASRLDRLRNWISSIYSSSSKQPASSSVTEAELQVQVQTRVLVGKSLSVDGKQGLGP